MTALYIFGILFGTWIIYLYFLYNKMGKKIIENETETMKLVQENNKVVSSLEKSVTLSRKISQHEKDIKNQEDLNNHKIEKKSFDNIRTQIDEVRAAIIGLLPLHAKLEKEALPIIQKLKEIEAERLRLEEEERKKKKKKASRQSSNRSNSSDDDSSSSRSSSYFGYDSSSSYDSSSDSSSSWSGGGGDSSGGGSSGDW